MKEQETYSVQGLPPCGFLPNGQVWGPTYGHLFLPLVIHKLDVRLCLADSAPECLLMLASILLNNMLNLAVTYLIYLVSFIYHYGG